MKTLPGWLQYLLFLEIAVFVLWLIPSIWPFIRWNLPLALTFILSSSPG